MSVPSKCGCLRHKDSAHLFIRSARRVLPLSKEFLLSWCILSQSSSCRYCRRISNWKLPNVFMLTFVADRPRSWASRNTPTDTISLRRSYLVPIRWSQFVLLVLKQMSVCLLRFGMKVEQQDLRTACLAHQKREHSISKFQRCYQENRYRWFSRYGAKWLVRHIYATSKWNWPICFCRVPDER